MFITFLELKTKMAYIHALVSALWQITYCTEKKLSGFNTKPPNASKEETKQAHNL